MKSPNIARGGTELMADRIDKIIPRMTKAGVRIVHGNPWSAIDLNMINIFVAHDLPHDKGIADYFNKYGFTRYDAIVCVSHWQRDLFAYSGFPVDKLHVIENFIDWVTIHPTRQDHDTIRFIYTSTPHRGLQELVEAFKRLSVNYQNIHLDVYSSFKLYGNPDADAQFASVFEDMDKVANITSHGTVSNSEIRQALVNSDCFVYPSKWQETSCLCLIEAMAAGIDCIHTDLAALPETSGGLTRMYKASPNPYTSEVDPILVESTYIEMKKYVEDRIQETTNYDLASIAYKRANVIYAPNEARVKWEALINNLKGSKYGQNTNQSRGGS